LSTSQSKGFAIKLALSATLLVVLFVYVVDVREMLRIVRNFDPAYLALALLAVTADRVLMTYKWTVLLKAQGYRLPLLPGVAIYCASMVWGMALPATVGADAVRAAMTTRRGLGGADVVASIVIERMVGFVLALALSILSLGILRSLGVLGPAYDIALWLGMGAWIATVVLLLASMNESFIAWCIARLPRFIRESKPMHYLTRFTAAYHALGAARAAIAKFAALTVLEQFLAIIFPWTLALGLGVPADLLLLLGVLPIASLISRLPVSVDGLGVYESVFVGLMLLAGISADAAFAIAISGRVIQLLAFLPWWAAHGLSGGMMRPPSPGVHQA
jgi:glycosyltransferase 2 family protein